MLEKWKIGVIVASIVVAAGLAVLLYFLLRHSGEQASPTESGPTPPPITKHALRVISYLEGWGTFNPGTPQNYTDVLYAFVVSYRFFNSSCSAYCTMWISADTATEVEQNLTTIRVANPNVRVFLSLGGWNLAHLVEEATNPADNIYGCQIRCRPENRDDDNPINYAIGVEGCVANPDKDKFGNFRQPIFYCYSNPSLTKQEVTDNAVYVAQKAVELCASVGAVGFDIDIEDTCGLCNIPVEADANCTSSIQQGLCNPDVNSNVWVFLEALTRALKTIQPTLIVTHTPLNSYVVKDTRFNPQFHKIADTYVDMLKRLGNYVDYINVQFYNNPPFAFQNPSEVIEAYDALVDEIYDGDASRVTVGMCSITENGTCTDCETQPGGCSNGQSRANDVVKPLFEKYGDSFGGVMQWASLGDADGAFSNPMRAAMGL